MFPALAIAEKLQHKRVNVEWLGTPQGMENSLLATTAIPLHRISVKGLRGTGILRWVTAPFMLLIAFIQSINVIRRVKPDCILGMGGFVCGPAGIAAKILGRPLLIHEQNAIPGLTNNYLAKFAKKVFESFPNTFAENIEAEFTGNPLRSEIQAAARSGARETNTDELNVLILGGSQGALAINNVIPEIAVNWPGNLKLAIRHQSGSANLKETVEHYEKLGQKVGESIVVEPFINDMASAYQWADIVICRSGASTVSELAALGLPSILIPYPYHKDQQQLLNAQWLESNGAASIILQSEFSAKNVLPILLGLGENRKQLSEIGNKARELARLNADDVISNFCLEVANA